MDNQHICKKLDVISIFDLQHYGELRERIVHQQMAYQTKRVGLCVGDWVCNGMCVLQEQEKREHLEKKGEGEEKNRGKKSQPGFDGRWYTDTDSHTQHRDRYKYTHFRSSSCLFYLWGSVSHKEIQSIR